ncbi:hypothetical protein J6590_045259 [Homalodisca vitripennis]|nr:hypothetical protein J6590_045259 [Homalodisca vitripennis]
MYSYRPHISELNIDLCRRSTIDVKLHVYRRDLDSCLVDRLGARMSISVPLALLGHRGDHTLSVLNVNRLSLSCVHEAVTPSQDTRAASSSCTQNLYTAEIRRKSCSHCSPITLPVL